MYCRTFLRTGDIMMVALIPLFSLQSIHFVANSYGCAFIIVASHNYHFYKGNKIMKRKNCNLLLPQG